jgi:hypothetical protein
MPNLWKKAGVAPIPKSHPPYFIPDNLRPISPPPILSKNNEIGNRQADTDKNCWQI